MLRLVEGACTANTLICRGFDVWLLNGKKGRKFSNRLPVPTISFQLKLPRFLVIFDRSLRAQDFACGLPLRSRPQYGSSSNLPVLTILLNGFVKLDQGATYLDKN